MTVSVHRRASFRADRPRAVARWWLGCAVAGFLGLAAGIRADTTLAVATEAGSRAAIKLSLLGAQAPRFGFAPVLVSIENTAPDERTWTIQFQSGTRVQFPGLSDYRRSITVPAGRTTETWCYVPIAEPGTPGGSPTVTSAGGPPSPPAPTSGAKGSTVPQTKVAIEKTPAGTKVTRTTYSPRDGSVLMAQESEIDERTGVISRRMTTASGMSTQSQSGPPPPGAEVTVTIDPSTGNVGSNTRVGAGALGRVTVHIITAPAARSAPPTPTGSLPPVTITRTPTGTKVSRSATGAGAPFSIEEEIDAKTGVIKVTHSVSGKATVTYRNPPTLTPGSELTLSIDPVTGDISNSVRTGSDLTAAPKISIITGTARPAPSPPATRSVRTGVMPSRVGPSSFSGSPMTLSVEVSGPGVVGSTARVTFPTLFSTANMRPMAASGELEPLLRGGLIRAGVSMPDLAGVNPAQLPADWRVWSAFANVILTVDEYAGLDAGRRAALRAWVATGGQLWLFPANTGAREVEAIGVGRIYTLEEPLKTEPSLADLLHFGLSVGDTVGFPGRDSLELAPQSSLGAAIRDRESDTTWLGIFLVIFAILVGPVNLFVFAPPARRHRLFITTPLISLGAALVLGGAIVVQDGLGGQGFRRALIVLVPGDHQAAVFQEQASRSGFLSGTSFTLADDVQLAMLPIQTITPTYSVNVGGGAERRRTDRVAAGGWFLSRGRQTQLLERVVPTRGRVERVGTGSAGAPIVESSLATALRDFVCIDDAGDLWTTPLLRPGQPVTLQRGGKWIGSTALGGTKRFDAVLEAAAAARPGRWGAKTDNGELAPIATLTSLKWTDLDVIVTGALEGNAPPKEAKP